MLLKKSNTPIFFKRFLKFNFFNLIIISLIGTSIIIGSMAYGAFLYKTTRASIIYGIILNLSKSRLAVVSNYVKGKLSKSEHIYLDIKFKNHQKLAYYRDIALEKGGTIDDYLKQEKIPANLRLGNESYDVDLSLIGQNIDHIGRPFKWSLKVKVKRGKTVLGMKEFMLLVPNGRGSPYDHPVSEWVCHQLEKEEGLISLRYNFVDVTINGRYIGVYAVEEHFGKYLIEHNKLREGIIFKPVFSDVSVYNLNTVLSNPALKSQLLLLQKIWKTFTFEDISVKSLFNVDKLAKYYALADLVNGHHTHWAGNTFFYFNPITRLLEPIGREWQSPYHKGEYQVKHPIYLEAPIYNPELDKKLFKDSFFVERYIAELDRISQTEYLDKFFMKINHALKKQINILNKDYYAFQYSNAYFYDNQKLIRDKLHPPEGAPLVAAYFSEASNGTVKIDCLNLIGLPLKVIDISYNSIVYEPLRETIVFNTKQNGEKAKFESCIFRNLSSLLLGQEIFLEGKIRYKILGTNDVRQDIILPWPYKNIDKYTNFPVMNYKNYSQYEFITEDKLNKTISIKRGRWNITQNLIIPKGFQLFCSEGTQLILLNSAVIISYSPIKFLGTAEKPILFFSSDKMGQGLVVMNAGETSVLKNVIFDALSFPSQDGWALTGSITFYESPVSIIDCQFLNNRSEDCLNIIRSNFSIRKSLFKGTFFDAFDSDFSNGQITNSSFINCGNDGIDLSGSDVILNNIFINGAGDKGISIGEVSKIAAEGIQIKGANIAVASKDSSEAAINNITISDCNIGFALYQKKPEFGPASVLVRNLNTNKVNDLYLVEQGSLLTVEGKKIKYSQRDVKKTIVK